MENAIAVAVAAALLAPGFAPVVAAQDEPRFEVASVRPHRVADDVIFAHEFHDSGRFTAIGTLRMLIRAAYRLQDFQLVGGSGWMDDERFAIDARAGRDAKPDEMRVMLRALLREAFWTGDSFRATRCAGVCAESRQNRWSPGHSVEARRGRTVPPGPATSGSRPASSAPMA
jgi:hypothetical protein